MLARSHSWEVLYFNDVYVPLQESVRGEFRLLPSGSSPAKWVEFSLPSHWGFAANEGGSSQGQNLYAARRVFCGVWGTWGWAQLLSPTSCARARELAGLGEAPGGPVQVPRSPPQPAPPAERTNARAPGGSVVKNPLASAGDTSLIPDPGRSHVPRSN